MAAPKQSGHMNTTDHDALSRRGAGQFSGRSALPLLDSVAFDPCPSRWSRIWSRAVPASLALLGALAIGTAGSILGPADSAIEPDNLSWNELARVARMQLAAADPDPDVASDSLTGAASDLSPDGAEQSSSRAERMKARKEAAEARRAAAKERREAAKQARLEARQARLEARKARMADRDDDDDDDDAAGGSSASERREARRAAYAERKAAAKEKREAAAAARREALEERRAAYAERKAAAKEKRQAAAEARHAAAEARHTDADARHTALQERRDAAKAKREEALAARREAAEERREARRAAKEERMAAREEREEKRSRGQTGGASEAASSGSFGRTETAMAPASGAALLRINSRPWAQVYVDGRLVGNTPQLGLQLAPGEHNVRLVNGVFAMGKVLNVKLRAGERVTRVEMLEE